MSGERPFQLSDSRSRGRVSTTALLGGLMALLWIIAIVVNLRGPKRTNDSGFTFKPPAAQVRDTQSVTPSSTAPHPIVPARTETSPAPYPTVAVDLDRFPDANSTLAGVPKFNPATVNIFDYTLLPKQKISTDASPPSIVISEPAAPPTEVPGPERPHLAWKGEIVTQEGNRYHVLETSKTASNTQPWGYVNGRELSPIADFDGITEKVARSVGIELQPAAFLFQVGDTILSDQFFLKSCAPNFVEIEPVTPSISEGAWIYEKEEKPDPLRQVLKDNTLELGD